MAPKSRLSKDENNGQNHTSTAKTVIKRSFTLGTPASTHPTSATIGANTNTSRETSSNSTETVRASPSSFDQSVVFGDSLLKGYSPEKRGTPRISDITASESMSQVGSVDTPVHHMNNINNSSWNEAASHSNSSLTNTHTNTGSSNLHSSPVISNKPPQHQQQHQPSSQDLIRVCVRIRPVLKEDAHTLGAATGNTNSNNPYSPQSASIVWQWNETTISPLPLSMLHNNTSVLTTSTNLSKKIAAATAAAAGNTGTLGTPTSGNHASQPMGSSNNSNPMIFQQVAHEYMALTNHQQSYSFDHVFSPESTNNTIFDSVIKDIILSAMQGIHGSVYTYGQTSSGKTYTMNGLGSYYHAAGASNAASSQPVINPHLGIIPQAVACCFDSIQLHPEREFLIRVSYLEVYNEQIKDLLATEPALIKIQYDSSRHQTVLSGVKEQVVLNYQQVIALMKAGEAHRHVGVTDMNEKSSRAHTLFKIIIESKERSSSSQPANQPASQQAAASSQGGMIRVSTLSLVDLAGSESAKMTNSKGDRAREAKFINQSLLTLSTIIQRLSEEHHKQRSSIGSSNAAATNNSSTVSLAGTNTAAGTAAGTASAAVSATSISQHLPYRDSKLTRLLANALDGQGKIAIICTVAPTWKCLDETIHTLKFGTRAKMIQVTAKVNESMDDKTLLRVYRQEIEQLKSKLQELEAQQEKQQQILLQAQLTQQQAQQQQLIQQQSQQMGATQQLAADQQQLTQPLTQTQQQATSARPSQQQLDNEEEAGNTLLEMDEQQAAMLQMITEMERLILKADIIHGQKKTTTSTTAMATAAVSTKPSPSPRNNNQLQQQRYLQPNTSSPTAAASAAATSSSSSHILKPGFNTHNNNRSVTSKTTTAVGASGKNKVNNNAVKVSPTNTAMSATALPAISSSAAAAAAAIASVTSLSTTTTATIFASASASTMNNAADAEAEVANGLMTNVTITAVEAAASTDLSITDDDDDDANDDEDNKHAASTPVKQQLQQVTLPSTNRKVVAAAAAAMMVPMKTVYTPIKEGEEKEATLVAVGGGNLAEVRTGTAAATTTVGEQSEKIEDDLLLDIREVESEADDDDDDDQDDDDQEAKEDKEDKKKLIQGTEDKPDQSDKKKKTIPDPIDTRRAATGSMPSASSSSSSSLSLSLLPSPQPRGSFVTNLVKFYSSRSNSVSPVNNTSMMTHPTNSSAYNNNNSSSNNSSLMSPTTRARLVRRASDGMLISTNTGAAAAGSNYNTATTTNQPTNRIVSSHHHQQQHSYNTANSSHHHHSSSNNGSHIPSYIPKSSTATTAAATAIPSVASSSAAANRNNNNNSKQQIPSPGRGSSSSSPIIPPLSSSSSPVIPGTGAAIGAIGGDQQGEIIQEEDSVLLGVSRMLLLLKDYIAKPGGGGAAGAAAMMAAAGQRGHLSLTKKGGVMTQSQSHESKLNEMTMSSPASAENGAATAINVRPGSQLTLEVDEAHHDHTVIPDPTILTPPSTVSSQHSQAGNNPANSSQRQQQAASSPTQASKLPSSTAASATSNKAAATLALAMPSTVASSSVLSPAVPNKLATAISMRPLLTTTYSMPSLLSPALPNMVSAAPISHSNHKQQQQQHITYQEYQALLLDLQLKQADNHYLQEELNNKNKMLSLLTEGLKEVEESQRQWLTANQELSNELAKERKLTSKLWNEIDRLNEVLSQYQPTLSTPKSQTQQQQPVQSSSLERLQVNQAREVDGGESDKSNRTSSPSEKASSSSSSSMMKVEGSSPRVQASSSSTKVEVESY